MENEDSAKDKLINEVEELHDNIKAFIHDIGSPLSAIWGYTNLATLWLQKEDGAKEELADYLNEINGHMREIEQITKNASSLISKFSEDDLSALLNQASSDNKIMQDSPQIIHTPEKNHDIGVIDNANIITDMLSELMSKNNAIANIHINEEDITGTEVKIKQVGSDYIQAVLPKNMGFYMLIPTSSIYYIKVKPSTNYIDIYMR